MIKRKKLLVPTMMRLTPRAKRLLETAAEEQRRSQASVLESLILDHLYRYSAVQDRLNQMLAKEKDYEREDTDPQSQGPLA
jgi:hypothetical protein